MFNSAQVTSQVTLSQLVPGIRQAQGLYSLANHRVEMDLLCATFDQAISFKNCLFVVANPQIMTTLVFATEAIRMEDCRLEVGLAVWGNNRQNNTLGFLGQDGPNVFVEGCEFASYTAGLPGHLTAHPPWIQLMGTINHCRIVCGKPLKVSFMQCKFFRAEISGNCNDFQISESTGGEFNMSNFCSDHLWFQRDLISRVQHTHIDEMTIQKFEDFIGAKRYPTSFLEPLEVFSKTFRMSKNGRLFLKTNRIVCDIQKRKKPRSMANWVVYGWFLNFYSTLRVLISSATVIFIFGLFYFLTSQNTKYSYLDWAYFSSVTFTTLGYGDIVPVGIHRIIAPFEAMVGIVSVIVTGWTFTREIGDL